MIFVAVSQDKGSKVVAILFEKIEVGDRYVYSIRRLFRKPHPGIDDYHFVAVADAHAVHSELTDAAQRYYFYLFHYLG